MQKKSEKSNNEPILRKLSYKQTDIDRRTAELDSQNPLQGS